MLRIAIIGAGPAGLSFYHHLTHHFPSYHALHITVFDSHSPAPTDPDRQSGIPSLGGGYGLAANGMASLKRMGGGVYREVFDAGFPTAGMVGWSARGHYLGFVKWWVEGREGVECCVMVLRERVLDALRRGIPDGVVEMRKVVDVRDEEEGAVVVFEGGDEQGFDVVVGADGVWSKTRRAVVGVEESVDAPVYKKLFTVAGFVETRVIAEAEEEQGTSEEKCQTFMTFGPNGMFGCTPYETGEAVTEEHIRGEKRLQAGKMAFWWARSEQEDSKANPDNDVLHRELLSKVKTWNAPIIHKVVENSKVVLKIPTFVLKTLPTWHSRRVVLLGDAAHAMPSSSGQGVSQSFEDAEALALLLAHHSDAICSQDREEQLTGLQNAFGQYEKARKTHVEKIVEAGNRAGDQSREMSRWQEWVMYGILKIVFGFFGSSLSKPALEYDVVREVEKVKDAS